MPYTTPERSAIAMSSRAQQTLPDHALNLFISYDLKRSVEELATTYDRTVADVVRTLLRIGLPILKGLWEAEASIISDELLSLDRPKRRSGGKITAHTDRVVPPACTDNSSILERP